MNKKKKAIEKEIDCQISIKNNHWNAFILSFAGSLGLIFTGFSVIKSIFIITGLVLAAIFFYAYLNKVAELKYLVKKLEEE